MKSCKYVVSCDWFAVSCISDWAAEEVLGPKVPKPASAPHPAAGGTHTLQGHPILPRDFVGTEYVAGTERFRVESSLEFNPAYMTSVLLTWRTRPLLYLFYRPRNHAVNPRSCQAKVANPALYSSTWPDLVRLALRAIGWQVVRIARLDVCADFQYFANGRLPLRFVQDYLSAPRASRPSYIRKSSNKFRCAGVKGFDRLLWETVSWGTRDSAVQVNLYNKTAELMAKQDKIYIREKWAAYGLPSSIEKPVKDYVWRVEFSINPSCKFVYDPLTRACRELLLLDVSSQARLEELFAALVPQFFQFYAVTASDRRAGRRVKDLPPVVLFDVADCAPFQVRGYSHCRVSGRTERILLRRLGDILAADYLTAEEKIGLRSAVAVLSAAAAQKESERARVEADDLLADFLTDISRPQRNLHNDGLQYVRRHRELVRLVAMLKATKSPSFEAFGAHYAELDACIERLQDEIRNMSDTLPDWFYAQD